LGLTQSQTQIEDGMRPGHKSFSKAAAVALITWIVAAGAFAQIKVANSPGANTIKVDCNKKGSIGATLAHLSQTGNTRGVTISVTGTCKENITIAAFDHLVIQGSPSATIQDASNGTAAVVTIYSSFDVLLQGLIINGGVFGVDCIQYSFCFLVTDTIEQSAGDGVRFARSNGNLQNNNILNHTGRGIVAVNGSTLATISNKINDNGAAGVIVNSGSNLTSLSDTVQNNAGACIRE
jgi:hypothetical protein